jgi:hypothetical protein
MESIFTDAIVKFTRGPGATGNRGVIVPPVPDLSPSDVRAMAAALGLPLDAADIEEVTHRLNAYFHALAPLASLPLEAHEPHPVSRTASS